MLRLQCGKRIQLLIQRRVMLSSGDQFPPVHQSQCVQKPVRSVIRLIEMASVRHSDQYCPKGIHRELCTPFHGIGVAGHRFNTKHTRHPAQGSVLLLQSPSDAGKDIPLSVFPVGPQQFRKIRQLSLAGKSPVQCIVHHDNIRFIHQKLFFTQVSVVNRLDPNSVLCCIEVDQRFFQLIGQFQKAKRQHQLFRLLLGRSGRRRRYRSCGNQLCFDYFLIRIPVIHQD